MWSLSGAAERFGVEMEAVLFAAARSDNVEQVIKPALEAGKIVLCDRYIDSSRVYQGVSGGVDMVFLLGMEQAVTEGARPDLTLMFDLTPEEGLKRAAKVWADQGPDRFEKEDLAEQRVRRDAFLEIAEIEPERCVVIDASKELEEVNKQVDRCGRCLFAKTESNRHDGERKKDRLPTASTAFRCLRKPKSWWGTMRHSKNFWKTAIPAACTMPGC